LIILPDNEKLFSREGIYASGESIMTSRVLATPDDEVAFIRSFAKLSRSGVDHQAPASFLLRELKRISAALPAPVTIVAKNIGTSDSRVYVRLHGVLGVPSEPILWALCGPTLGSRSASNCKVEILPKKTSKLRDAGVLDEIEHIRKKFGATYGDDKTDNPTLKIGITPAITEDKAAFIADCIADIARIALPVFA
jgi:hypothetical protein